MAHGATEWQRAASVYVAPTPGLNPPVERPAPLVHILHAVADEVVGVGAVDYENCPRHIPARIRSKEYRRIGNVLRLPHVAKRDPFGEIVAADLVEDGAIDIGFDRTGRQGVHAYPARAKFNGKRAGEHLEC